MIVSVRKQIYKIKDWYRLEILGVNTVRREIDSAEAKFICSSIAEKHHYRTNFLLEEDLIKSILYNINKEDVFWDVGANVGLYSCLIGQKAASIAIEPSPQNVARLNENFEINNVSGEIIEAALGKHDGNIELTLDERGQVPGAGRGTILPSSNENSLRVKLWKGDSLIEKGIAFPNIVKIDVEGAELDVIGGMESILSKKKCRLVFCEHHIGMGGSKDGVIKSLTNLGFSVRDIMRSQSERIIIGEKQ